MHLIKHGGKHFVNFDNCSYVVILAGTVRLITISFSMIHIIVAWEIYFAL